MTPKHWRGDGGPGDRALLHITADDLVREELASTGPRSLQVRVSFSRHTWFHVWREVQINR
jgi:hypothetical protein